MRRISAEGNDAEIAIKRATAMQVIVEKTEARLAQAQSRNSNLETHLEVAKEKVEALSQQAAVLQRDLALAQRRGAAMEEDHRAMMDSLRTERDNVSLAFHPSFYFPMFWSTYRPRPL